MRRHVEDEDVAKHDTPTTSGIQQMLYVNESGLYSLILGPASDDKQLADARTDIAWRWARLVRTGLSDVFSIQYSVNMLSYDK